MRLLLCVDDDPVLEEVLRSLEWGLDLSRWSEIVALHVAWSNPLPATGVDIHPSLRAESLADRVARRLSHLPVPVQRLLTTGEPAPEIARVADECEADLIVMGARGERRDFLMGSVSQKVVSMAPTDVLVVRVPDHPKGREAGEPHSRFRALLAVDGSAGSEAGIDAFTRKLRARDAAIHVVHVVEAIPTLWDLGREREREVFSSLDVRAREILGRALTILECRGLSAEGEWRRGSPATQIVDAARESSADVIVVGSRGRSGIRNMVLGSMTHRVLRHAPCTVLCAKGWALESGTLSRQWSESREPEIGMA